MFDIFTIFNVKSLSSTELFANVIVSVCVEQKTEALESGTKRFEELEFCQLEEESRMEEKKETQSSWLLQEQGEFHRRLAQRKVRNV